MLKSILIANRGEIALRIIRTCREMDIPTVAVYSTEDKDALHVQFATRSICIGAATAAESYLNLQAVMTAAVCSGCDAIHPGYGFLSENADFADICSENNIKFIGPSGKVIRTMGNKAAAKKLMREHGIPVVPGSNGAVATAGEAMECADEVGYPVLLKASAGGGGRGMRRVNSPEEIDSAFIAVQNEAEACFGDNELYVEKLILNPKHIEFQILADKYGNVVHLGERDCSIQRKNQKLVEESPSYALTAELRNKIGEAAVRAAAACGYEGAGTVEFILTDEGEFYFIEMNTRVQVEHPVSEMISGVDIIKEQIRIASGCRLELPDITLSGHAIECRINCEDPKNNFTPCPGITKFLHVPGGMGVRVDTALYTNYKISPYYDSLIAKIIVHAPTRMAAIKKMRRALEELIIDGYATTGELAHLIMYHPAFIRGRYNTGFIEENLEELLAWGEETDFPRGGG